MSIKVFNFLNFYLSTVQMPLYLSDTGNRRKQGTNQ